jgi:hypothetical protein
MNAAHGETLARLMDRLSDLDEATPGHPEVLERERLDAVTCAEWLVLDHRALDDHICFLRKRFGPDVRHQALLPEEEADRVLRWGGHVLSNGLLAVLLLNPIALLGLASQIDEELPDYWLDRMAALGQAQWQAKLGVQE